MRGRAKPHQPRADLERAGQIEANRHHHQAKARIHQRRLQLKAPANHFAGLAQHDDGQGDSGESNEDSGGVEQGAGTRRATFGTGKMRQAERLHAENRKHARH